MLQHYVLIRYEKSASDEDIAEFCRRMLALRTSIASIEYLEIGRDILHDARSWDLILIMKKRRRRISMPFGSSTGDSRRISTL